MIVGNYRASTIPLSYDRRVLLLAFAAGLPAIAVALSLIFSADYPPRLQWTLTVLMVGAWAGCALAVRRRVVQPLQTIANLLAALRERDFSIRAREPLRRPDGPGPMSDDPLAAVMLEVNELASTLYDQRLGALEAGALLRTVMSEIEVAVFTFDGGHTLRFINRAGERLLGRTGDQVLGRTAQEMGLDGCLEGATPRVEDVAFPGGSGRWEVRRTTFRQEGRPHHLLVLSDVSRPLRDEERQAWQRLIRVIGHEINNSLAPIKSIAGSLEALVKGNAALSGDEARADMARGLAVIAARADSLGRFTTAYARLARLPPPRKEAVRVLDSVRRAISVETRVAIDAHGEAVTIRADPDQLEQLLINLLRNAADAVLETGGSVRVGWMNDGSQFQLWIDDEGVGVPNASNLFVPFFTTKPGGSGIGLVLSRQIAEAHGGTLTLENRSDRHGARALLKLPV